MAKKSRTAKSRAVAPTIMPVMPPPLAEHERRRRIRNAIEALRDEHGRVTAELVVEAARNPNHPLHGEFDWNIERAAHQHWLDHARALIKFVTVVVVHRSERITVPFYVRNPMLPSNEQGMVALNSDLIDRQHAIKIVTSELSRCRSAVERARGVTAILNEQHPGLSDRLEVLLRQIIETEELVAAA